MFVAGNLPSPRPSPKGEGLGEGNFAGTLRFAKLCHEFSDP